MNNGKVLKRFEFDSRNLEYFFIGGMNYSESFSWQASENRYPFTTYYVNRVEDIYCEDIRYRSLFYCKLPLICLQFEDRCECIEFTLPARCGGEEVMPFVGLKEDGDKITVLFKHFPEISLKEKDNAWLGLGEKTTRKQPDSDAVFETDRYTKENWKEAVLNFFEGEEFGEVPEVGGLMERMKRSLRRSFDSSLGTFLQLPWKNATGFVFSLYSYSLPSFEARRLEYFDELYDMTGDPEYKKWSESLEDFFTDRDLYRRCEDGLYWSNMTHFDGEKIKGLNYLDVGYAGYPGAQGTIAYYLSKYLRKNSDDELESLVREGLDYIVNTQNEDGSWDSARAGEGFDPLRLVRDWRRSEGSTGQNARALISGYRLFGQDKYIDAAKKGLDFLKRENIICRNVLRDIGIDEPEGFSAILCANAFLDAYHFFEEDIYLEYAKNYVVHLLTHHYWYGPIKGHFHPITESITPRLSPYESLLAVKVYDRMYEVTDKNLWMEMRDLLFRRVSELVSEETGLSEGVFLKYPSGMHEMKMDQTFANSEMLYVSSLFEAHESEDEEEKIDLSVVDKPEKYVVEDKLEVDKNKFRISKGGDKLDILMSDPYSLKSKFKTKVLNSLRKLGFCGAVFDFPYLISGVQPRNRNGDPSSLLEYIEDYKVDRDKKELSIEAILPFHELKLKIYKTGKEGLVLDLAINVTDHDVQCDKVIVYFGEKYDETLKSNWTQGGFYRRRIPIKF